MLVPDWIYSRIPYIWLSIGLLFLLIGLAAGPEFRLFHAYILFSLICLFRALYVYQARRRFHRRNRVAFLHETQVIDHTKK
jgi:prepilin signal peptidase PulO-like enzyme (type II secretory pathway)